MEIIITKKRTLETIDENLEVKRFKTEPTKLNCLNNLPVELKVIIFKNLDYKDLSIIATVSRSFRDVVINHFLLSKEHILNTFQKIDKSCSSDGYFQLASDLGLLIKRATFIFPIVNRIKVIMKIFQIIDLKDKLICIYSTDKTEFKFFVKAIKAIVSKLIRGWKFKEVLKLYDEFELYMNNIKLIQTFLIKDYGIIKQDEQYIRFIYRKILFESFDDNLSRGKWLNYFLNYHTNITSDPHVKITYQAKLLLLLFSPIFQEENSDLTFIDWYCFSISIFTSEGLEYLGFAFKLLNSLKSKIKPNIVSLFKACTNIANFWLYENSATLLYYCGANVTKQFIESILKKSDYENHLYLYLSNLFVVESKLIKLGKINNSDTISNLMFNYMESVLHVHVFENIMERLSYEFIEIAKLIDIENEDREFFDLLEVVDGQRRYYELRLKRMSLTSLKQ